jgi:hypothetical protein
MLIACALTVGMPFGTAAQAAPHATGWAGSARLAQRPQADATSDAIIAAAQRVQAFVDRVADQGRPGSADFGTFAQLIGQLSAAQQQLPPNVARPLTCYDEFMGAWSAAQQGLAARAKAQAQQALDCYTAPGMAPPPTSSSPPVERPPSRGAPRGQPPQPAQPAPQPAAADDLDVSQCAQLAQDDLDEDLDTEFFSVRDVPLPDPGACTALQGSLDPADPEDVPVFRLTLSPPQACLRLGVHSDAFTPEIMAGSSHDDIQQITLDGSGPGDTQTGLFRLQLSGITPEDPYRYLGVTWRETQGTGDFTLYLANCASGS